MGEENLANWLKTPAPLNVIRERQAGIGELTARVDLREDLAVIGDHANVGIHPAALLQWAETPNRLTARWMLWRPWCFQFSRSAPRLFGVSPGRAPFFLALLVEAGILAALRRPVDEVLNGSETAFEDLRLFSDLLMRVEREQFTAPPLQALLTKLRSHTQKASQTIGSLSTLVNFAARAETRR